MLKGGVRAFPILEFGVESLTALYMLHWPWEPVRPTPSDTFGPTSIIDGTNQKCARLKYYNKISWAKVNWICDVQPTKRSISKASSQIFLLSRNLLTSVMSSNTRRAPLPHKTSTTIPMIAIKVSILSKSGPQNESVDNNFRTMSNEKMSRLHEILLKALISCNIPLTFLENPYFQEYQSELTRSPYKLPRQVQMIEKILPMGSKSTYVVFRWLD
ncbi:hypothetical protein VP01_1172g2 [Puccinia sorghi]|uniref:Uncharacterized protein n=1 Tax=Puccinia sorghi TaxID=27349 RepID=A0A0L6VRE8_9BASI|nr:hypothetical protein VP01_1172g2 [Puccinia sorghi]